jgi:flagellar biosynthesis protein FlhB
MAGEDKTEKPTPKRRQQAREEGTVARSMDLNGAMVMVAGLFVLLLTGPRIVSTTQAMMVEAFAMIADPSIVTEQGLAAIFGGSAKSVALSIAPIAAACLVVGLATSVAQVGWKPTPKTLKPRPKVINPLTGAKNLFGPHGLVEGGKSLLKVAVIGGILAVIIFPRMEDLAALVGLPPEALGSELVRHVRDIAIWAAAAYIAIGILDVFYQRYRTEKQLKMTKEEVKREAKDADLPPEVRGQIRKKQREAAIKRMMGDVPTADVVVTNPTHYAVALRYDGSKPAPELIAKGKDLIAKRIREIAEEHGVPVVSDPPLARSLHKAVEIGQEIPESLFQAVAKLLAYVYRQAGRRAA